MAQRLRGAAPIGISLGLRSVTRTVTDGGGHPGGLRGSRRRRPAAAAARRLATRAGSSGIRWWSGHRMPLALQRATDDPAVDPVAGPRQRRAGPRSSTSRRAVPAGGTARRGRLAVVAHLRHEARGHAGGVAGGAEALRSEPSRDLRVRVAIGGQGQHPRGQLLVVAEVDRPVDRWVSLQDGEGAAYPTLISIRSGGAEPGSRVGSGCAAASSCAHRDQPTARPEGRQCRPAS